MDVRRALNFYICGCLIIAGLTLSAQTATDSSPAQSSSSKAKQTRKPASKLSSGPDKGAVADGLYRNPTFGFSCKIPAGWVLRTEEMNAQEDESANAETAASSSGKSGRVLLAAFSRPPAARGEDVNSSILIAAESASSYPGLKDAAQYFVPVVEVAKAQGLDLEDDPYEFAVGPRKLVRGDFQKDVASRVLRQATLVLLAHGWVLSFTFIGGTEDEVEELVQGLSFGATAKQAK
jgi:hypothetical protein